MAGFIDSAVQDIDSRLKELKEEQARLLAARAALAGTPKPSPSRPAARKAGGARRGPGRPRGRRGGSTRSAQALELVRNKPGITIPELASTMKIEPNYLYRVMPKLTADGLVKRNGQGWHPVAKSA